MFGSIKGSRFRIQAYECYALLGMSMKTDAATFYEVYQEGCPLKFLEASEHQGPWAHHHRGSLGGALRNGAGQRQSIFWPCSRYPFSDRTHFRNETWNTVVNVFDHIMDRVDIDTPECFLSCYEYAIALSYNDEITSRAKAIMPSTRTQSKPRVLSSRHDMNTAPSKNTM